MNEYKRLTEIDISKKTGIQIFGVNLVLSGYDTERDLNKAKKDIYRMLMLLSTESVYNIMKFLAQYRAEMAKREQLEYNDLTERAKMEKQIKSRKRVKEFAEVFTAEREVKAMCDLIPSETWENITSTFLEPACGTWNFLAEIYSRKLQRCKNEKYGLKALASIYGVDIQSDNVAQSRLMLVEMFVDKFPESNDIARLTALAITTNNIVCDDFLNPKTETLKSWNITAYVKEAKARIKEKQK